MLKLNNVIMIHISQFLGLKVNQNLEEARKYSGIDDNLKTLCLSTPPNDQNLSNLRREGKIASIIFLK